MEIQEAQRNAHLVLVPYPLQGHMTPMLQLASILHSKGFSITIVHTKFRSPKASDHPDFIFLPVAETLTEHHLSDKDFISQASIINSSIEALLQEVLTNLMKQKPRSRVNCIVYDAIMYSAEAVASSLKLPSIVLRTSSASSFLAHCSILHLGTEGLVPLKESISQELVPGLNSIRYMDLSASNYPGDLKALVNLLGHVSKTNTSSAVLWNSVDCLEHDSLTESQQQNQVHCFSIGPLHRMASTASTSLLTEDTDCITWLDKQATKSVIYVSLGSLATMEESEFIEMARGLVNAEQPFLWVVRPGSIKGSAEGVEHFPEGYLESIQGRGCIVKWAPQKEVLAHSAVGGFLSHSGWNSTLESICEGVPMICRPAFGDQKVNSRYISHLWKTGIALENGLDRQKIETAIRRLMQDQEGKEMRQRAAALKEEVKNSIDKGGSSYNSMENLVELILSL